MFQSSESQTFWYQETCTLLKRDGGPPRKELLSTDISHIRNSQQKILKELSLFNDEKKPITINACLMKNTFSKQYFVGQVTQSQIRLMSGFPKDRWMDSAFCFHIQPSAMELFYGGNTPTCMLKREKDKRCLRGIEKGLCPCKPLSLAEWCQGLLEVLRPPPLAIGKQGWGRR